MARMINKAGIHIHTQTNIDELLTVDWGTVIGLHHQLSELAEIKKRRPDIDIMMRYYHANTMGADPKVRAQEISQYLLTSHDGIYPLDVTRKVIPICEPNQAGEHQEPPERNAFWGSVEAAILINEWLGRFLVELHRLLPGVEFYGPSLSPRSSALYQMQYMGSSMVAWHGYSIHCYGDPADLTLGGWWRQFLNSIYNKTKPIYITEYNQGNFAQLLNDVYPIEQIKSASWFLAWTHDPDFYRHRLFIENRQQIPEIRKYIEVGGKMDEFVFGVKTEAERLREIGIDPGKPYRDEYWFTHDLAVQATTTGQFWIHKIGENFFVQFYPKAGCSR